MAARLSRQRGEPGSGGRWTTPMRTLRLNVNIALLSAIIGSSSSPIARQNARHRPNAGQDIHVRIEKRQSLARGSAVCRARGLLLKQIQRSQRRFAFSGFFALAAPACQFPACVPDGALKDAIMVRPG